MKVSFVVSMLFNYENAAGDDIGDGGERYTVLAAEQAYPIRVELCLIFNI
jgi:hypothetical protein